MKSHVVREMFNLDGVDYPRGTEITDREILKRVCQSHPHHLVQQHHDAPDALKEQPKPASPAPAAAPRASA